MCTSVIRVIYSWYVRLKPACFVEKTAEIMNKKGPRGLWGWWRHGWQVCCILGLVGLNWFGSLQASVLSRPTTLQQLAVPLHGYFWWSTEQWLNHTIAAPVNRYCTLIGHKIQYSTQCTIISSITTRCSSQCTIILRSISITTRCSTVHYYIQ